MERVRNNWLVWIVTLVMATIMSFGVLSGIDSKSAEANMPRHCSHSGWYVEYTNHRNAYQFIRHEPGAVSGGYQTWNHLNRAYHYSGGWYPIGYYWTYGCAS